jgi:hypothetical protein
MDVKALAYQSRRFCASLSHVLLSSQIRTSCRLQIIVPFVMVFLCHADDMEIAPDFFDYFEATAPILDADESLYAVSSWNDNGQTQFVHDSGKLRIAFELLSFCFCTAYIPVFCFRVGLVLRSCSDASEHVP